MRKSPRPDLGRGGLLEQLDRYPVTLGVIAANVVLFVFCATRGPGLSLQIQGEVLYDLGANVYPTVLVQPWRLITSAFLHTDLIHLALNGIALFIIGRIVEVHYGSPRTWVLFVACALGGSVASDVWQSVRGSVLSAGASGGTVGLIFLGFVYAQSNARRLGSLAATLRSWILALVIFSVLLYAGLDHAAHVGGAAVGALCGWLVQPRPGEDAHPLWGPAAHFLALLCLAAFGAVVWSLRRGGAP